MKNITESWKTSIIGIILILVSIVTVFIKITTWTDVIAIIVIGIGLLFSPDKLINKLFFLVFLFSSCNPIKAVINDKEKLDIVAKEVIRRGYCITDTVVVTKDSIIVKDSIVKTTVNIPCPDIDTTINGAKVVVKNGILSIDIPVKVSHTTNTITNTVRDLSIEKVLKEDLAIKDGIIFADKNRNLEITNKYNGIAAKYNWLKTKVLLLIIIFLVIIFRKIIFKAFIK